MPFLHVADGHDIREGVWCPLQLIGGLVRPPDEPRVIRRRLNWELNDGYDPYDQHFLFGHLRRDVANLLGYSDSAIDAIDARQTVVLLSPFALWSLLSVMLHYRAQWGQPEWRFNSEAAFQRLPALPASSLDILVRV